jgi:hypothetical protein
MPIRPELRHLYRGPAWNATRERVLKRAENRCEQCGVPNRKVVMRAAGWWALADSLESTLHMFGGSKDGRSEFQFEWHPPTGAGPLISGFPRLICRYVGIVLTIAHLNHTPGDDRDENLKALCQWCHLNYDKLHHHETRATRKDAARPLLREDPL